jgi:Fic family protein
MIENAELFPDYDRTFTGTYTRTHPWITFNVDLTKCSARMWIALGEARSKCEHLAGVPLKPEAAKELHQLYLAKGAHATTAIEGNTLSEEQVIERIKGNSTVPPSQKYLETEIDNVVEITSLIMNQVENLGPQPISAKDLKEYNRIVLQGLAHDEHVVPGEYRDTSVGVMDYKAPDAKECDYLMTRLCHWLNTGFQPEKEEDSIVYGVIKSVVAHLYLAWIHAFGDGNGRTARATEVRFLMEAGVPSSAIHLLSNHYNHTRSEYYRQLSRASKNGGDIRDWLTYSIDGLVDQLRLQLKAVRTRQWRVSWVNYIYEKYGQDKSAAAKRQIKLLLTLSEKEDYVSRADLRRLSVDVAEAYAGRTPKTMARDLAHLEEEGLINRRGNGDVRACPELILAFLPRMRKGDWEAQFEAAV